MQIYRKQWKSNGQKHLLRDGGATTKTSSKRKSLQLFVSKILLKNNDLYLFYKGTLRIMFTQLCTNVCFVFILFYSFVYFQYARTKQWLVARISEFEAKWSWIHAKQTKMEFSWSDHTEHRPSTAPLGLRAKTWIYWMVDCPFYLVCENVTWYRRKSQPKHPSEFWYFIHFLQLSKCYNNQMKGFCFVFYTQD